MGPMGLRRLGGVSSEGVNSCARDRARAVSEDEGKVAAVLSAAAEQIDGQPPGGHTE